MLYVQNHGSICLIIPDDRDRDEFALFIENNVDPDHQTLGGDSLVVEPRYLADLMDGLAAADFEFHRG